MIFHHHLWKGWMQEEIMDQLGIIQELRSYSFGDNSPMHLFEICCSATNVYINKGL